MQLGLRELAVTSDGRRFESINKTDEIKKPEKRLSRADRKFSRKLKNKKRDDSVQGKNLDKQRLKVQRLYQRLCNARDDHINKTIAEIVKTKPSYIAIADIDVVSMLKNKFIAKAVRDQKLRYFRENLTAKCHEQGIELRVAPKHLKLGYICSFCGAVQKNVSPANKYFRCDCGFSCERVLNVSYNLKNMTVYKTA